MYIIAYSTISHQNTFDHKGFSLQITESSLSDNLIHPDYKEIIPPMERRRMTDAVKMGLACSHQCLKDLDVEMGGIIVGTSMGSSQHTKKFLDNIIASGEGPVSPTPFIQSTHNTIAGQISLYHKNNNYNNTHTQNTLSFEHAMFDAMLMDKNGADHILFGSSDESENTLFDLACYLNSKNISKPTTGASFFLSSLQPGDKAVQMVATYPFTNVPDKKAALTHFLEKNNVKQSEIKLIAFSTKDGKQPDEFQLFQDAEIVDFNLLGGHFLTNSAFGFSYAVDRLLHDSSINGYALVYNNLKSSNLGLSLIKRA